MAEDKTPLGRQFRVLLAARLCVWIAGGVTGIALPLALYQRTGSAALTALLAALEVAPYLLVGLFAGAVADRFRTRPVAIITCLLCAAASGSVSAAQMLGMLTIPHLFIAALAAGIALVFFDGAMFAALPAIVPRERLSQAFATMTATATVIVLVGPMAGGFIAAAITPELTLLIDAALLCAASVVFAVMREPERERSAPDSGVLQAIGEGLRFIVRTPLVRGLTALGVRNSIAEGLLSGMLVATVVVVYGMPNTGPQVGIAHSATTVVLNGVTQRARVTPDHLQGRVNTTARMFAWGGQPIGALAGAALVGTLGIAGTHLIGIAVLLLTAAAAMRVLRPAAIAEEAPHRADAATAPLG